MNEEQRRNAVYPANDMTNENHGTRRHEAIERMPRLGEVVHYYPDLDIAHPMAAIVTAVWGPNCVNLFVPPNGVSSRGCCNPVLTSVSRTRSKTDVQVWDFA